LLNIGGQVGHHVVCLIGGNAGPPTGGYAGVDIGGYVRGYIGGYVGGYVGGQVCSKGRRKNALAKYVIQNLKLYYIFLETITRFKLEFSNPNIFTTWCIRPSLFTSSGNARGI